MNMDIQYMQRALDLAKKGSGFVHPNPMVGAVIVKDNRIIGEGYHRYYGKDHAEVDAIKNVKENIEGSTIYVTLEPCSHYGKTPPCAEAIVANKIKKVVIAMKDPNPLVAGRGIEILRKNNIEVVVGVLEKEAKKLNEIFIKYITTNLPFCILKTAMTLDGKIASVSGDSKWISNGYSRKYVHEVRHQVSAIMVGVNTVIQDDPLLTTRLEERESKNPLRIIIDTKARIPLTAKVLMNKEAKTIIVSTSLAESNKIKQLQELGAEVLIAPLKENKVNLSFVMEELGKRKIDSVLLEGGSTLNFSALQEGIVDKVITFIAPKIIGGECAKTPVGGNGILYMKDAIELKELNFHHFGEDIMVEGYL